MPPTKHHIVSLDSWVTPPPLDFDHVLDTYPSSTPEQVLDRVKNATILIISTTHITRAAIQAAPQLQLIACNSTGTDQVDRDAVRELGISLCHVPAQNTDSVAEHAFALYYALRKKIIPLHSLAMEGMTWPTGQLLSGLFGEPPRTNSEETLVVVGYGAIGRKLESIATALGMRVMIAERKGASAVRLGRVSFSQALKKGTLFILSAPIDSSTQNMFGQAEFQLMDRTALLVNVGRGGIVNEKDLVEALQHSTIGGAATDVYEYEPATKANSPLLDPDIPNLVLSPHIAWYASRTIQGTLATAKANLESFVAGSPRNIVIAGKDCL